MGPTPSPVQTPPEEALELRREETDDLEAYDFYLQGRSYFLRPGYREEDFQAAENLFARAIALDPEYITPHFGLAVVLNTAYVNGWGDAPEETLARGFEIAQQAVAIDPFDPQGHWALAMSQLWRRNLDEAIERANEVPFSFQAALFTRDIDTALRTFKRFNASAVMVNDHTAFRVDWMPFGGHRQSVLGHGGIGHSMQDMTLERMVVFHSPVL